MATCNIFDRNGKSLGTLSKAKSAYTLKDVPLDSAKLVLPWDDEENALCVPLNRVELFDGDRRVELFRIIASPQSSLKPMKGSVTYNLEHVLAYLCDNIMPGYHEIGGTGCTMRQCIEYILKFQSEKRWILGQCDFETQFQYSFSHAYLLNALLSLTKQLEEAYHWTFDTTSYPWTLHLLRQSTEVECEARYQRNMHEIQKTYDAAEQCTRAWGFGYGEGVNQLTVAEANGGVGYVDADTISQYGIIEKSFSDTRFEQSDALLRRTRQWLEEHKHPRFSYVIKAVDIYSLTGEPMDHFYKGKLCRINDQEHGVLVTVRVTQISKPDPVDKPGDITVTLANNPASVANELADLAARASINELYAQGSTVEYPVHDKDEADEENPMEMEFYVDEDTVRINKVIVKYKLTAFRATSKSAASGGGVTSSAGGASSATKEQTILSHSAATGGPLDGNSYAKTNTDGVTPSGTSHYHFHGMWHEHNVVFKVTIPSFTLSVPSHTHSVPEHEHGIIHGIYKGNTASSVTVKVDGNTVPASAINNQEFNAVPYLSKDESGKILRGTWHKITIAPDSMTRIITDVHVKTFVRSQGGGDY